LESVDVNWSWSTSWELEGRFWEPGDTEHRFYGRLRHTALDGPTFHFVDSTLNTGPIQGPAGPIEILLGETLGGIPLTVLGFYPSRWAAHGLGSGNTVDGFADSVIAGAWLATLTELEVSAVSVKVHGLLETLTGGTAEGGPLNPTADEHGCDRMTVELSDGVGLVLQTGESRSVSRRREHSEVTAGAHLSLKPPLPFAELERKYLQPLCDLVLFATRRPSYVESLAIKLISDSTESFHVVRRPFPQPDARSERDVYALALNLGRVHSPTAVIKRWFELSDEVGPVWQLLFSTLGSSTGLLENRLLNLVAFVEGYHRALHDEPPLTDKEDRSAQKAVKAALRSEDVHVRKVYREAVAYANSQTQRDRLDFLTRRCLLVLDLWDLDCDAFCEQVSHTRNWLIHWGKPGRSTLGQGSGMYMLFARLEVIVYANLMLDVGLTREEVAQEIGSGWRLERLP
jgi:hypothetical protein